jgi:hypothetical protein
MEINDNRETVTCRICGEQCKRIYGKHLKFKHENMSTDEYKDLYPGAPIMALSDKEKTTTNSGKHMKDEKYKKMFSDMFKGDNNPNHKSKTTEIERKSRSPFSKNFVKYNGIENVEEHISFFAKNAIKDRVSDTTLQYYLNKGYNEELSKQMLIDRQRTFTLEKCIEKHGEVEGINIFNKRQSKWQDSLNTGGNLKIGYSNISQEFFNRINNQLNSDFRYATNGGEFKINRENGGIWVYDFVDIKNKKIIEYQGDEYHANPLKFSENDTPHPFRKNITAKNIWMKDEDKLKTAIDNGYEVLYVWDSEYSRVGEENKNKIIEKCIDFLKK